MGPRIAMRRRRTWIERYRLKALVALREIIPSCIRFIHMGIDIYAKHGSS
jgi:hypothetical protein